VGVQWSHFQRLRTGITWLPVLRAASRVSERASENRWPGRVILPPIPQLLRWRGNDVVAIGLVVVAGCQERSMAGKRQRATCQMQKYSDKCGSTSCPVRLAIHGSASIRLNRSGCARRKLTCDAFSPWAVSYIFHVLSTHCIGTYRHGRSPWNHRERHRC
jgi:hypothetical protein